MTTEISHDLKFDKGTVYIVYFHTHIHVHIEKMGYLSKSKIKLYIGDNKLRSCAQRWSKFAAGCKLASGCIFIKHRLHDQNTPQVQIYTLGDICTRVYIVHMNEALHR